MRPELNMCIVWVGEPTDEIRMGKKIIDAQKNPPLPPPSRVNENCLFLAFLFILVFLHYMRTYAYVFLS
jgi:hypothetical protein